MRRTKLSILWALTLGAIGYTGEVSAFSWHWFHHQPAITITNPQTASIINTLTSQVDNLSPEALQAGLTAYENARKRGLDHRKLLTIVDYSQPSTQKRLFVIDLSNYKVLYNTLVAHGKNSGDNYATHFSNDPTSDESSLGVFLTGNTYVGEHGPSMRLLGLERGFNNNAYARAIVMHSAWYVSDQAADVLGGRIGRSWGCLALDPKVEPQIVNTIKDGTLIVAYYPDKTWLSRSQFLRPINGGASFT